MKQLVALAPEERADTAARLILEELFVTLQSSVSGVLSDTDPEFLHDLRVAARRTRTALSQTRGVLPETAVEIFLPEFKWLGSVSGRRRDLDVALLGFVQHHQRSDSDEPHLDPLREFLEEIRTSEHDAVSAALTSQRFTQLVEGWGSFLQRTPEGVLEGPLASHSIVEIAGPRIMKAFKRIRKRGSGIAADAPASLLHQLRVDGKKLRYLLEFFGGLYSPVNVSNFIKDLKKIQDVLGEFNDAQVELALIGEFNHHVGPSASTLVAIRRRERAISERERELRIAFADRFRRFTSEKARRQFRQTFTIH